MATNHPTLVQSDFSDLLFSKTVSSPISPKQSRKQQEKKHMLSPKQRAGFREDYNKAVISLYIIGCLFNSEELRQNMPEEIKHIHETSQKTQERYERYMPKASQKIIHYGRDVVDAYMSPDGSYLRILADQAEHSKYPDKWRMYSFATRTVDKMVDIVRTYNEII